MQDDPTAMMRHTWNYSPFRQLQLNFSTPTPISGAAQQPRTRGGSMMPGFGDIELSACAKGVESRMINMNGVDQATLDLNRGEASLVFTDNHNTSLAQLQQSIVDGGFSPKEAQIKVQGTLGRDGQQWKLVTEAGDIFLLEGINAESSQIGQQLLIEGVVEEQDNQEDFWRLTVRQAQSAG